MKFFNPFKAGAGEPKPAEVWNADPLLIADVNGEIVFAGRVDIEVIPLGNKRFGMRTLAEGEPSHWLSEAEEFFAPEAGLIGTGQATFAVMGRRGIRPGRSYAGVDQSGSDSFWYLGSSADAYLLAQNQPEAEL